MDVLIAHGDGQVREALMRALRASDAELIGVADGVAALELLMSEDGPRVALVDWDLPRLDGCELCRLLRDFSSGRQTYLILLASEASDGRIDAGLEAGAHDFVTVPVADEDLRSRVEYACRVVELPWGRQDTMARESAPAVESNGLPDVDERRIMSRRLDEEVERARRDKAPLSIAVLHFEGLGELRRLEGSGASAAVLREASRRLRDSLRPYDGLGWSAADELLVTMPKADDADIEIVLDRLHAVLEGAPFAAAARRPRVTVAIGGATRYEHTAPELLAAARCALEEARREGPGRVVPGSRAGLQAVIA